MKRILLTALTSSLLAAAVPGVASANHGKRHHGARHANSHKRHAKRARLVTFGSLTTAPAVTTPTTPTTPTPAAEPAGKVLSFENGVLVITLADKSTVSGKVTEATRLECSSATAPASGGDDQGSGDDSSGGESHEHAHSSRAHASSHDEGQEGQQGDDGDDDNASQTSCTQAALVPGAVVGGAELSISSAGAVWEKVELLQ
ncbi:MAG: hypothetical protein JWL67_2032 [Solirubrobacterales bacterium]|jgi:hypothetical protein|nr:hypothetical protein [Solirubrobacterales bacterium]